MVMDGLTQVKRNHNKTISLLSTIKLEQLWCTNTTEAYSTKKSVKLVLIKT